MVQDAKIAELQLQLAQLAARLDSMDAKITVAPSKMATTPVIPHPSEGKGKPIQPVASADPAESGYSNDPVIQNFRKAMLLFRGNKLPDSMLAFSGIVEQNPDHPLAGVAQYYVGESYFAQKEYRLAAQEYQRVLTSYDRSPNVSHALLRFAECQEFLKNREEAAKNRQLLTSLFPQSPAAGLLTRAPDPIPAPAPVTAPAPAAKAKQEQFPALDEPPPPTAPISKGPQ